MYDVSSLRHNKLFSSSSVGLVHLHSEEKRGEISRICSQFVCGLCSSLPVTAITTALSGGVTNLLAFPEPHAEL